MIELAVWPDPIRGIAALLSGQQVDGRTVRPVTVAPDVVQRAMGTIPNPTSDPVPDEDLYIQLAKHTVETGQIDRVVEVRATVYGPGAPTSSDDLAEAILSYLCGVDIETPGDPSFYFDSITHRDGPTIQGTVTDLISPSVFTVAVRARPML